MRPRIPKHINLPDLLTLSGRRAHPIPSQPRTRMRTPRASMLCAPMAADSHPLLTDEVVKRKVHAAMELPGCRLKVYWRSFWSACGDEMRFKWLTSEQFTSEEFRDAGGAAADSLSGGKGVGGSGGSISRPVAAHGPRHQHGRLQRRSSGSTPRGARHRRRRRDL